MMMIVTMFKAEALFVAPVNAIGANEGLLVVGETVTGNAVGLKLGK